MTSWSVVTVTYNSRHHLERHWRDRDRAVQWIVVDNGSTDGTAELAEELADIVVISPGNVGFSRANNAGLARVDTSHVSFVNPDVKMSPLAQWGDRLAAVIESTGALVGPQLLNPDGSEQANARGVPYLDAKIRNRLRPDSDRGLRYARTGFVSPTYCAWLMGAAVCGSTSTVRSLGGWDESYFLYYEDHELGLRAWREGVPVVVDPEVRWIHEWQRETSTVNSAAWKRELRAMRTFFTEFPWLVLPGATPGGARRLDKHGYGDMLRKLWTTAPVASDQTRPSRTDVER